MVPADRPIPPSSGLAAAAVWCVVLLTGGFMLPFYPERPLIPPLVATAIALGTAVAAWWTRRDQRVWRVLTVSMLLTTLCMITLT